MTTIYFINDTVGNHNRDYFISTSFCFEASSYALTTINSFKFCSIPIYNIYD